MRYKQFIKSIILRRSLRKLEGKHDRLIKKAQKAMETSGVSYKESSRKIDEMVALYHHECEPIERDINMLMTRGLLRKAKRLSLPIPWGDKEMWTEDYGDKYLSTKGAHAIRKNIRDEQKEKRDIYLPWVCAITGLIGSLIGLTSLLLKKLF
jgi:hypothetical protein